MSRKPVETESGDRAERAVLVLLELGRAPKRTRQQELASTSTTDPLDEDSSDNTGSAAQAAPARNTSAGDTSLFSGTFAEQADEFRELVRSAGATIAAEVTQRRDRAEPATLIGGGKVEEAAAVAGSVNADVVLFAHDLTPSQLRNLEKALPCRVIDRTQLILDIFARHARTREGQLQVELAQLSYMLPRLGGRGTALSQQGGGIGTRGPGERKLETDRRRINRRMDHIRAQLESVRASRRQQRQRREAVPVPTVALVGYTNAGKSTLFNALTQAGVLESSRMFATLDPKLRAITLPSRRRILLADTVGFVRDLPHTLVTSFRATLEEVQQAEVLLHVRDASSPALDRQKDDVETVLAELDVGTTPRIEVLNKSDLLPAEESANIAGREGGLAVSGLRGTGLDALLLEIERHLLADPMEEVRFRLPQSEGRVLAALEGGSTVLHKRFAGNIVYLEVAGPASLLGRYRHFIQREATPEPGVQPAPRS